MKVYLKKNLHIAQLRNGQKYLYTNSIKGEILPIFLSDYCMERIKNLNGCDVSRLDKEDKRLINSGILGYCKHDIFETKYDFDKSRKYLLAMAYSTRTPLYAKVELTYKCQLKCEYCIKLGNESKELSLEELKNFFCR